ncbi:MULTISPECIES: IDEAL domain-containing protein [unclassified Virgibacillus]|uniref:IDEAL domain-containing protein n=1 Tax=unclassified Virgibacillus TaxID=2620237 RepID=UPI0024DEC201|nr:IDEAL domain-containing protein [Virgibacillus sp. LDC-1]
MKKEKVIYRVNRYAGRVLHAKREIPFEIKLTSRLILDELCFNWNKKRLEQQINTSIDNGDQEQFNRLGEVYKQYIWE